MQVKKTTKVVPIPKDVAVVPPVKNIGGRPPKEINWLVFEGLCEIQCTVSEIASVLKVSEDTLYRRVPEHYEEPYASVYKKYAEGGKSSLRRIQFNLAKKNTSMAIWLGKQWLGQKDISKEEVRDIGQDIINAIRDCEARNRNEEASRPALENKQPLLDKELSGKSSEVRNELGAEGTL